MKILLIIAVVIALAIWGAVSAARYLNGLADFNAEVEIDLTKKPTPAAEVSQ